MDKGIQVIVVDDKSTLRLDEFEECKAAYSAQGVLFFTNEGVKGGGNSRNVGITHARGKWLLFSDADDYFIGDFFEIVQQYFDAEEDIVYFPPTSQEEGSGYKSVRHLEYSKRMEDYRNNANRENELNLKYRLVGPWSKLIRRDMIQQHHIRFDKVMHSNDVMFSIKAAYHSRSITVSPDTIYCIMRNDSSLTSNINVTAYCNRCDIWIKRYLFMKKHLCREDFNLLDLFGGGRIIEGIETGVGVKVVLQTIIKFKHYHIHIIPKKFFNLKLIKKWLLVHRNVRKGEKRFYHK
jgi:glycosyltransferase involved in cell wall biosynthesis